ncbi:ABC transporter permease [Nocardioides aquiterrae]|uniref:ABC transporter permease n=1 Tax=Nocardioides aquiterrae TaxID=203799 RepID=A0ABN1U909_9ACTN
MTDVVVETKPAAARKRRVNVTGAAARVFARVGALPILLAIAVVVFAMLSPNFLTVDNLQSALRQNAYIAIIVLAQFVVLVAGGFDLSVGSITALVSVASATAMSDRLAAGSSPAEAIVIGLLIGLLVGLGAGAVNAVGIGMLKINPFIMTLATASIFAGLALKVTAGVPVSGLPADFSDVFGYSSWWGVSTPIWIAIAAAVVLWALLRWTRPGRNLYAVGSNPNAARLSGISPGRTMALAYMTSGVLVAVGALLLTARLQTGESNIGADLPLLSIAAAVIGGVSLRGGSGNVLNAVLGAVLLGLVTNGMNLARIESYYEMIVLGVVLAVAVLADRLRGRVAAAINAGRV